LDLGIANTKVLSASTDFGANVFEFAPESRERPMKPVRAVAVRSTVICCAAIVSVAAAAACYVTPEQEQELGAADAAHIDSTLPLITDSVITGYVAALGRSMASKTSRADLDWHFSVVNSPEVNAFALPGGFIYVNRGAIEQADREDELAGIVGHEIGHVVRRHSVEQLQKRAKGDAALVALCTLTLVCHTIGGRVAIDVGSNALSAHYSQHDEAQADSEGVVNTLRVGIDPEGLPSFFEKLLEAHKERPTEVEAFFSTHPTDESRVAATRQQIHDLPAASNPNLRRDASEFHAIQERVRALPKAPSAQ
jgi:beta-barrel assembly-enhancing protease